MKFKATILGKSWQFTFVKLAKLWGDCSDPAKPRRTIRIDKDQDDKQLLNTVIHESLHAAGWHIDEEFVRQFATDVAAILVEKLKYRRPHDGRS